MSILLFFSVVMALRSSSGSTGHDVTLTVRTASGVVQGDEDEEVELRLENSSSQEIRLCHSCLPSGWRIERLDRQTSRRREIALVGSVQGVSAGHDDDDVVVAPGSVHLLREGIRAYLETERGELLPGDYYVTFYARYRAGNGQAVNVHSRAVHVRVPEKQ